MKSGYHQMKVREEDRCYFAIQVGHELLQFTVLPFGWNGSPFFFTKMMNAFMDFLRSDSLTPSNYLDDVGLLHFGCYLTALRNNVFVTMTCSELGVVIEKRKSQLTPLKVFQLLGIVIDLINMKLIMSEATIEKIRMRISTILSKYHKNQMVTSRELFRLTGVIIAYIDCFQPAKVMLNPVYSFQSSRQSTPTLSRIESNNGISSSCLGEKMVVEANRVISGSVHNSEWKRLQSLPRRERGTMQKIMGFKSNVNRLQGEELSKIADTLMSCCVEESTAKNYHSYWHRFMEFLMKSEESPPPSSEMVVRFLTYLFIKTPSGNNCRQAMYAIKHFCKMIGWEDPTCCVRVHTVIRGMCNLATVASKKERDPWRLDFIRSWVRVGRQFVEERAYVLYTCLMIFGIRSWQERLKMIRKEENHTGSDLCPMKWLQRLFETRPKGNFLFTGELPLNTVEISYILSQVAILIEADPGKYSSHSLRIGGATEAAIMGIPEATIKAMGGWNSDAIDRYFRANFKGDRNGSRLMGF